MLDYLCGSNGVPEAWNRREAERCEDKKDQMCVVDLRMKESQEKTLQPHSQKHLLYTQLPTSESVSTESKLRPDVFLLFCREIRPQGQSSKVGNM